MCMLLYLTCSEICIRVMASFVILLYELFEPKVDCLKTEGVAYFWRGVCLIIYLAKLTNIRRMSWMANIIHKHNHLCTTLPVYHINSLHGT